MTTKPQRVRGESGETLVELLMTIAIVSIAFVGILAAVAIAILSSHTHRQESTAEGVIRSFAESVDGAGYVPCPTVDSATYSSGFTAPSGWPAAQVTGISYWQGDDAMTFGGCPGSGDKGLQRVSLRVQSPAGDDKQDTETLIVLKRQP